MKVLYINSVGHFGSTGRIVDDLCKIIKDWGHQCLKVFGRGEISSIEDKKNISKIGIIEQFFLTRLFDLHGRVSIFPTKRIIRLIRKYKPDVIHLHNLHGYYVNYSILFSFFKSTNIPIVWTLHDCWSFTGHCAYFDYLKCDKWLTECFNCPAKKDYPKSIFFDSSRSNYLCKRKAFLKPEKITLVSPSIWLDTLVSHSFLGNKEHLVINNGIDITNTFTYDPEKKKTFSEGLILAVASPWTKRKGYGDLFSIAKQFEGICKFAIIGLTKKQCSELPESCIKIERTKDVKELVDWYQKANVFINTSYEDNFPTTNLEALACGTPVVTYETGGSVEAIDKNTGTIVKKGDWKSLTKVAISLIYNKKYFKYEDCRQRAELKFNKDDRYFDYLRLYCKLTGQQE